MVNAGKFMKKVITEFAFSSTVNLNDLMTFLPTL